MAFATVHTNKCSHIHCESKKQGTTILSISPNVDRFLANVNSRSRSLYAVARPSVCLSSVGNTRAPYSGGSNFRQYFYGIWYPSHPLTLKISRRSSQGNPSAGELNTRGVVKYSDFGPIDGYISETVQDRRQVCINLLQEVLQMSFRLVPKSVTLNGVMVVSLCYFSEFDSFRGALHKSG